VQFLNPAVLFGLIASAAPLLIHLLHRGTSRPVPFSNLAFLRRLQHSHMRRVRCRQWLVLALRTLAIACLVLAFARPAWRGSAGRWVGRSPPVCAVALLDQSCSTAQRRGAITAFAQLKRHVGELAEAFGSRDRLIVLPYARTPGAALAAASPAELRARVAALEPTEAGTDVRAALEAADALLRAAGPAEPELFILSDLAPAGWPAADTSALAPSAARVYIVPAEGEPAPNLGISEVRLPVWTAAVGRSLTVAATVRNAAPVGREGVEVHLFLDGERVAHATTAVAAQATQVVDLPAAPRRPGRLWGFVELEDDALWADNRRHFVVDVPERIDVLVLGETPAATYYLRRALGAAAEGDPAIRVRSALAAELTEGELDSADVIVLSNVNRLDRTTTAAVRAAVTGGRALLVVPGAGADLNYYNRELLPGLIPVSLRVPPGGAPAGFRRLDPERSPHPLFAAILVDQAAEDVRFGASFDAVGGARLEKLACFDDGGPALVAGRLDRGRIFLWTTPVDLEWSALPLRGLFVPLWQRLVRELALPEQRHEVYTVGDQVLRLCAGLPVTSEVEAETPAGERLRLPAELRDEQCYWRVARADQAGLWRLAAQGTEFDRFVVNLDPEESVLEPVSRAYLERLFGAARLHVLRPGDGLAAQVAARRHGRELWRECLLAALLLLLAEHWLARAPRAAASAA